MSTVPFTASELAPIPEVEGGSIALPECPVIPRRLPWTKKQVILPVVIVILVVGMVAMMLPAMRSFGTAGMGMGIGLPLMMLLSIGMMMGGQHRNAAGDKAPSGSELADKRREFLAKLAVVRDVIQGDAEKQFNRAAHLHPEPALLPGFVGTRRQWERAHEDYAIEFGMVRIGTGTAALKKRIIPWSIQVDTNGDPVEHEPVALDALNSFDLEQTTVGGIAAPICLTATPILDLHGEPSLVYGLVRSMICQLAVFHSPLDLKIMVITADIGQWDWIKWLPHACDLGRQTTVSGLEIVPADVGGPGRLIWPSAEAMLAAGGQTDAIREELRLYRTVYLKGASCPRPHWVVFNDTVADDDWATLTNNNQGANGCTFIPLTLTKETDA
jgi:hypothetical protein